MLFADGDLEALQDIPRGVVQRSSAAIDHCSCWEACWRARPIGRTYSPMRGPFSVGYLVARVDVVTDPPDERRRGVARPRLIPGPPGTRDD